MTQTVVRFEISDKKLISTFESLRDSIRGEDAKKVVVMLQDAFPGFIVKEAGNHIFVRLPEDKFEKPNRITLYMNTAWGIEKRSEPI